MPGVVTKDRGWLALTKRLRDLDQLAAKVGVLEGAGQHDAADGLTVAAVAAVHEFGSATVPERSFIRAGLDGARPVIDAGLTQLARAVVGGMPAETAVGRLGLLGVREVQRKITDGPFEPLAERTIREKGSSRPLIDSGQMRRNITHEVVRTTEAPSSDVRTTEGAA